MKVDRVVVDSNVLISALLVPHGTPSQVLDRLAANAATLLFSDETFTELAVRLAKPKFDSYRTIEQVNSFLEWLSQLGEWVERCPRPASGAGCAGEALAWRTSSTARCTPS